MASRNPLEVAEYELKIARKVLEREETRLERALATVASGKQKIEVAKARVVLAEAQVRLHTPAETEAPSDDVLAGDDDPFAV
jgi:hypothetical protein